jgi:hypothetical protein
MNHEPVKYLPWHDEASGIRNLDAHQATKQSGLIIGLIIGSALATAVGLFVLLICH